MQETVTKERSALMGFIYGLAAYIAWGFLPLYWKLLDLIPATEILAHRITWSFFFVLIMIIVQGQWDSFKSILRDINTLKRLMVASMLITINWGTYIWAVNNGHVIEASMGYYINPLIVVLLGVMVLKEKLNLWQGVSLVFACIGVGIMTVQYGKFPWIAITLALSFGLYGLSKKLIKVSSLMGLATETILIMPLALGFILFNQIQGVGALGSMPIKETILLLCAGVATATPMLWFAKGTKRIQLSTMGFLQYISPTISLILGIVVFKETFTTAHLISFGFIWCGLLIYSLSQIGALKNIQKKSLEKYN
jgi:chloramphenicol-sensitive protein RarD